MNKYCPNCGKELEEQALFCSKCGKQVSQILNKDTNPLSHKGKRMWIKPGIILISIIIVIVVGVQLFGSDVKRPFELMNRAIEDRDTEVFLEASSPIYLDYGKEENGESWYDTFMKYIIKEYGKTGCSMTFDVKKVKKYRGEKAQLILKNTIFENKIEQCAYAEAEIYEKIDGYEGTRIVKNILIVKENSNLFKE